MAALVKGDRVRWNNEEWIVSSTFNTNTEGFYVHLRAAWKQDNGSRVSVPTTEVEKIVNR